jgi:hypothetical protein
MAQSVCFGIAIPHAGAAADRSQLAFAVPVGGSGTVAWTCDNRTPLLAVGWIAAGFALSDAPLEAVTARDSGKRARTP